MHSWPCLPTLVAKTTSTTTTTTLGDRSRARINSYYYIKIKINTKLPVRGIPGDRTGTEMALSLEVLSSQLSDEIEQDPGAGLVLVGV